MSATTQVPVSSKTPAPEKRKADSDNVSPTSVLAAFTEDEMKHHVGESLRCVLRGITAPFTCGGTIELETGKVPHVTLLESNETIAFEVPPAAVDKEKSWRNPDETCRERLEAQPQILAKLTSGMPQGCFRQRTRDCL